MNPEIIKVRPKGQITIPAHIREKYDIDEGDYFKCEVINDRIIFSRAPVYKHASQEDRFWKLIGSAEDKEGKGDVSSNKHKYLGE